MTYTQETLLDSRETGDKNIKYLNCIPQLHLINYFMNN